MSADEFWKDDPQLYVSYRTSFINKNNREKEELDYKCWLNGLYTHDGNTKIMLGLRQFLYNMVASFGKGNHQDTTKIDSYPVKPYIELAKENNKPKEKTDNKQDYQNSLVYYGSLKQIYMNKIEKNKKKGE